MLIRFDVSSFLNLKILNVASKTVAPVPEVAAPMIEHHLIRTAVDRGIKTQPRTEERKLLHEIIVLFQSCCPAIGTPSFSYPAIVTQYGMKINKDSIMLI